MNMKEILQDYYQHFYDPRPVNIVMVGESYWSGNSCVSRDLSDLTAIEYVIDGEGYLENNGKQYSFGAGDVYLLRQGTKHKYYNKKGSTVHKVFVTLSGELPEILINQYLPDHNYVYHSSQIEPILRQMISIAKRCGSDYNTFVDESTALLMQIFVELSKCQYTENKSIAYEIKDYLDSLIDKPFNLDLLCTKFGYSKNHIINKFSQAFETTPYQYYNCKKFETVKLYLLNTNFSLAEIAERLSFSDQQYFSAWFKGFCGISPSKYRKQKEKL